MGTINSDAVKSGDTNQQFSDHKIEMNPKLNLNQIIADVASPMSMQANETVPLSSKTAGGRGHSRDAGRKALNRGFPKGDSTLNVTPRRPSSRTGT